MSVVEFFMNYWDWYLLVSFIFFVPIILNVKFYHIEDVAMAVIIALFWPMSIAVNILDT